MIGISGEIEQKLALCNKESQGRFLILAGRLKLRKHPRVVIPVQDVGELTQAAERVFKKERENKAYEKHLERCLLLAMELLGDYCKLYKIGEIGNET